MSHATMGRVPACGTKCLEGGYVVRGTGRKTPGETLVIAQAFLRDRYREVGAGAWRCTA